MKDALIKYKILKQLGVDKNKSGVYKFWFDNKPELFYIGSTNRKFEERILRHIYSFNKDKCQKNIRQIIRCSILNGFRFEILLRTDNYEDCRIFEAYYITKYKPKLNLARMYYNRDKMSELESKNWTKKMSSLEVGEDFKALITDHASISGTKQRMKYKYPEKSFSILKTESDVLTIKRNK